MGENVIKVRDAMKNIETNLPGHKNYITKDEEGLIISKDDMEGSQSDSVVWYHLGKLICYIV